MITGCGWNWDGGGRGQGTGQAKLSGTVGSLYQIWKGLAAGRFGAYVVKGRQWKF